MRWGLPGLAGGEAFEPGPGDEGVEDWQEHDAVVVGQFGDGGDLVAEGVCGGPELLSAVDGQSAVVSAARSRPPATAGCGTSPSPATTTTTFT
jgi:hypothetical protein